MKVKYLGLFLPVLLILFSTAACKSTPPEEVPPPIEDVTPPPDPDLAAPDQASLNNLNAAVTRAEDARKLAGEFDGPVYFPADWDSAEGLYNQAQSGKKTATVKDVRESLARYNSAAAAYESLAEKTIPQYAAALEGEVIAARDAAISAGAQYYAQDYLIGTDDFAAEAYNQYLAKDYYKAKESGLLVKDAYGALTVGVEAAKTRLTIQDQGFVRYDETNINTADQIALSALDDYEAHNIASASGKAADVRARYTQSLAKARQSYSADCAVSATAQRQRALDLKANVAVRQEYNVANGVFNQGVAATQRRSYEESAGLYNQARVMFEAVTASAQEKRRIAEEALRAAELKMVESDEAAQRAELLIEGGSR